MNVCFHVLAASLIVACAGTGSGLAAPLSRTEIAERTVQAGLATADQSISGGDPDTGLAALQQIEAIPIYADLTDATKYRVTQLVGTAAREQENWTLEHQAYEAATASRFVTDEDWWWRLESAKLSGDFGDALLAFDHVYPKFAPMFEDETISALDEGFGTLPNAAEARFHFESALSKAHWTPKDIYFSPDVIRMHYAIGLLERGDVQHARVVVRALSDPDVIQVALADRRFDKLLQGRWAPSAVAFALDTMVDERKALRKNNPSSSYATAALAASYYRLGRYDEAVVVAQKALQETGGALDVDNSDVASGNQLALIVDADSLMRLKRVPEALDVVNTLDQPVLHISTMALLRAQVLLDAGQAELAGDDLVALSRISMRPDGQIEIAALQVCAGSQGATSAHYEEALGFVRAHPLYSARASLEAFACAAKTTEAVKYTVKLLRDPTHRHLILQELQIYAPDINPSPRSKALDQMLVALRKDPNVIAALKPVGRINQYAQPAGSELY